MAKRWARGVVALAFYALTVTWLTWPLGARLATHLPKANLACTMDGPLIAWVLAYQTHALFTDPLALPDANIFHPTRHALFYGQTTSGAVPYFFGPFLLTGNAALALNLIFLGGAVTTALALHLVVRRWTTSDAAGLVAGTTFLGTRWVLWDFPPSAPPYVLLWYLPWIVLLASKPRLTRTEGLTLLVLVGLQVTVDVVYVAVATLAPLTALGFERMLQGGPKRETGRWLLAAVGVGIAAAAPLYLGHLLVRLDNPNLRTQTLWVLAQAPLPSLWFLRLPFSPTAVPWAAVAVVAFGLAARLRSVDGMRLPAAPWLHAGGWAIAGVLLSLVPPIGPDGASGLFGIAGGFLRKPIRLGLVGLIGLCLLAGLGAAELARAFAPTRRRIIVPVLTLLVLGASYLEYQWGDPSVGTAPLPKEYPLLPVSVPPAEVLTVLRRTGGPLLELPVTGPEAYLQARAMLRSTYHWRRLVNGYTGYWPAGFPQRMELARRLPDPEALAALHRETGVRLILVHERDLSRAQRQAWQKAADSGLLQLVAQAGDERLFRVRGLK